MTQDTGLTSELRSKLEHEARVARERLEQFTEHAKHDAEIVARDARNFLRRQWSERPVATVAVAVGIGALLGLALSKRR